MEDVPHDGCSVSVGRPLLLGNKDEETQQKKLAVQALEDGHNSIAATTSFFKTCFNGLNALSGAGILSVAYALASGGWLSLILLLIIASSAFYTGLLIKRCMDVDPNIKTYPDIGEYAFGKTGRMLVSVMMYLELYLVATGFLILEGDNLHKLFPDMSFEIVGLRIGGAQGFVIIVGLVILPTVWLSNMNILSWISATGVLASLIILGSILWAGTLGGIGFHQKGMFLKWDGIPIAVSLYAFCYCAHPVFPTLYTSMENRGQFSKVLLLCFVFCTIVYASMAVLGYLMFGSDVQSQITLNLPTGEISSKTAIYTTLINPIAKYALMVTPIVNAVESHFPPYYNKRSLSLVIRTTLVITSVIVALTIPFFGYLMSLVGAFLSITASILLPCFCYLKISSINRRFGKEMVIIGGIIIVGILTMIIGTYTTLVEILQNLKAVE